MFEHLSDILGRETLAGAAAPDCEKDPLAALKTMFVDIVMRRRLAAGQRPAFRPVFLKGHGVALGEFVVRPTLAPELRVGVFSHDRFPAVVRFSSDTLPSRPDFKTTIGIAIKLIGVPGPKLLVPDAPTCDYLLQNHPVFFVNTASDMCEFTRAGVVDGDYAPYLAAHPTTDHILNEMQKIVPTVLGTTYWGLLPHLFGNGRFIKYRLKPAAGSSGASGLALDRESLTNYLYVDLKSRLMRAPAQFEFSIQFRMGNDDMMPLDRATVPWDEAASPPVHVATLYLPQQDIDALGQAKYGEDLSFNIWQTLPEHEPQGSLAAARRSAYAAAAKLRREYNQVPEEEPVQRQPAPQPPVVPDLSAVVRAEIHPAIGIARVGNSQEEYFIGPEVTDPPAEKPGFYKDKQGAIKRQAVRFRLFGYDKDGKVVGELNADNATFEWTVHVANKKSAWYKFTLAMDRPAVSDPRVEPAGRRNANLKGADRQQLIIDPGPRTIHGRETFGTAYQFDTGKFLGQSVYLGELRTDEAGRLLFLGGRGISRSAYAAQPFDFANNDGWHDDVSDGPVSAQVWIAEREIPVTSAWVVVAPPNYAPELKSIRTLYDLSNDRFGPYDHEMHLADRNAKPSFVRDIQPIFQRMCRLQWVNRGFAEQFGWRAPNEFLRPDYLAKLASASKELADIEFRTQLFNQFRNYANNNGSRGLWPWIYGDTMDVDGSQHTDLALSDLQLAWLTRWRDGDFIEDFDSSARIPLASLKDVPLAQQPAMLTRAALEFCVADAFHPGCEIGWIVRGKWIFVTGSPPLPQLRFRERPANVPEADYGEVLAPQVALSSSGPLSSVSAGDLTRWMAVPWQTDTASCRSGYEGFTTSTPTFWPARVPNDVLTEDNYQRVLDGKTAQERLTAFRERRNWLFSLGPGGFNRIREMIKRFGELGIVERRDGPDDGAFPTEMFVESTPGPTPPVPPTPKTAGTTALDVAALAAKATLARVVVSEAGGDWLPGEYIPKVDRFKRSPVSGTKA